MKSSYRKRTVLICLIFFVITAACGMLAGLQQYRDYQDKMEIIYTVAGTEDTAEGTEAVRAEDAQNTDRVEPENASEGSGTYLGTAAGLLKGDHQNTEAGREKLRAYGYTDDLFAEKVYGNDYLDQLRASWAATAGISLVVWMLLCGTAIFFRKAEEKRNRDRLNEIANVLSDLQAGDDLFLSRMELFEKSGMHGAGVLYDRISSLAESVRYVQAQADREKEATKSLVTDLTHQLKTPVAALGTSLEILKQTDLCEEERMEFTQRCLTQQNRLKELLDALINISRMETGMITIEKKPVRIFDTIAAAVSRIYPVAEQKEMEISVDAEDGVESMKINHDTKWFCEAILNVLENAVKYGPEGSRIKIRMVKRITFLRIEVEDEGIGIPQNERHLVFQRFYRGSRTEVLEQPGSGVGLYLTRRIVENHGGTIRVTSAPQQGSIFIIQIPYR